MLENGTGSDGNCPIMRHLLLQHFQNGNMAFYVATVTDNTIY